MLVLALIGPSGHDSCHWDADTMPRRREREREPSAPSGPLEGIGGTGRW